MFARLLSLNCEQNLSSVHLLPPESSAGGRWQRSTQELSGSERVCLQFCQTRCCHSSHAGNDLEAWSSCMPHPILPALFLHPQTLHSTIRPCMLRGGGGRTVEVVAMEEEEGRQEKIRQGMLVLIFDGEAMQRPHAAAKRRGLLKPWRPPYWRCRSPPGFCSTWPSSKFRK